MANVSGPGLDKDDRTAPGGIQWSPASPYARELCKFERTYTQYGPPMLPPYTHQDYPAMLYKATRNALGRPEFAGIVVHDAQEQRNVESRGYVAGGQGMAVEALEAEEREIATVAANRVALERTMSANARAEAETVDDATDQHVPVIPEARRGPGRPRKDERDGGR